MLPFTIIVGLLASSGTSDALKIEVKYVYEEATLLVNCDGLDVGFPLDITSAVSLLRQHVWVGVQARNCAVMDWACIGKTVEIGGNY